MRDQTNGLYSRIKEFNNFFPKLPMNVILVDISVCYKMVDLGGGGKVLTIFQIFSLKFFFLMNQLLVSECSHVSCYAIKLQYM